MMTATMTHRHHCHHDPQSRNQHQMTTSDFFYINNNCNDFKHMNDHSDMNGNIKIGSMHITEHNQHVYHEFNGLDQQRKDDMSIGFMNGMDGQCLQMMVFYLPSCPNSQPHLHYLHDLR
jgi:hypothetical protein